MARRADRWLSALLVALIGGCASAPTAPTAPAGVAGGGRPQPPMAPTEAERFADGEHAWSPETRADPPAAAEHGGCDGEEAALDRVARRLAHREALGLPPPTAAELAFALRASGSPHVWPRGWTLRAARSTPAAQGRAERFVRAVPAEGARSCGFAVVKTGEGAEVHAAVVVDALATLEPVPTHVASGAWLDVRARALVPIFGASVVVLGPSGPPHTVPSTAQDGTIRARVHVDRAGPWTVQIVATTASGPRPVLEMLVSADGAPPAAFVANAAPGENEVPTSGSPEEALARLVDAARRAEGLAPLERSVDLDRVARRHAEAMRDAGRLSHDLGQGDPAVRLERAGLALSVVGENVAQALDARRAHRGLWASPSHRGNLLDPRFNALGVGATRDAAGTLWVCEVFADFANTGISRALP